MIKLWSSVISSLQNCCWQTAVGWWGSSTIAVPLIIPSLQSTSFLDGVDVVIRSTWSNCPKLCAHLDFEIVVGDVVFMHQSTVTHDRSAPSLVRRSDCCWCGRFLSTNATFPAVLFNKGDIIAIADAYVEDDSAVESKTIFSTWTWRLLMTVSVNRRCNRKWWPCRIGRSCWKDDPGFDG